MNIESKQEKHEFQETNKFSLWSTAADRQFVGSKRMCIHLSLIHIFHVSVDDNVPFIQVTFMFLVHPNDESGIVHQYVYRLPFLRKEMCIRDRYKDVTLQLGEVYNLNVQMKESSELLEEVVVTAQKTKFCLLYTSPTYSLPKKEQTQIW